LCYIIQSDADRNFHELICFSIAKEAVKKKVEMVIRREFSIEIQKKEAEIELINQVFVRQMTFIIIGVVKQTLNS